MIFTMQYVNCVFQRNLRSLSIAQQYYNVRDYESARRFVLMYLSVKDDSSVAHKLLAQCYEQFNEKDKALKSYLYSLNLDPKQSELILKGLFRVICFSIIEISRKFYFIWKIFISVCGLLSDEEVVSDKEQLKHWYEKGEKLFPYHPSIQNLRKKVFLMDENIYPSLEALINGKFGVVLGSFILKQNYKFSFFLIR